MSIGWIFQVAQFLVVLTIFSVIFGEYIAKVIEGKRTLFSPVFSSGENFIYRCFGINPNENMSWKSYLFCILLFSALGMIFLFLLQELQGYLPLNFIRAGAVRWDVAANTAISYATNTNWLPYKIENTLTYFTAMLGLSVQNFLSAAVGIATAMAFMRALTSRNVDGIGNFWVDLTRAILYILLPLSVVLALLLISQGVVQNLHGAVVAHTLEGIRQIIPEGPAASQIAITHLGTNGGGFFNTNSAHPFCNPNSFTDYLEILSILIIAAALPFAFGAMLKNRRQGWAIYIAMLVLFIIGLSIVIWSEFHGNPLLEKLGIAHGTNLEGKEVRTGILSSVFLAQATTASSTGAINAVHDSLLPLTSLVLIFNMGIGEVIFGGVGTGFIGMIFYAILGMFIVGLMVGRTPEIYGKKLGPFEMIMVVIALMLPAVTQLLFSGITISSGSAMAQSNISGPHAISQVLYTFASAVGNNGSSMSGLDASTPFYNLLTGVAMLIGRFITIGPALAIAGSLMKKKINPLGVLFSTANPQFIFIMIFSVILLGALTYFPFLVLGPIIEHFAMVAGRTF